jgi:DNA repair protein RadC
MLNRTDKELNIYLFSPTGNKDNHMEENKIIEYHIGRAEFRPSVTTKLPWNSKVENVEDVNKLIRLILFNSISVIETMVCIALDNSHRVMGYTTVTSGSPNNVHFSYKYFLKFALDMYCTTVILAHNHPSNNPRISDIDLNINKEFKKMFKLIDVTVLENLIVLPNGEYKSI